jgi:hypothetical protein
VWCGAANRLDVHANAAFIAAARAAVPALLADVDALTQERDKAATMLGDALLESNRIARERDALAAELASYKRQAAYISSVIDSEGKYVP